MLELSGIVATWCDSALWTAVLGVLVLVLLLERGHLQHELFMSQTLYLRLLLQLSDLRKRVCKLFRHVRQKKNELQ